MSKLVDDEASRFKFKKVLKQISHTSANHTSLIRMSAYMNPEMEELEKMFNPKPAEHE